jgi:hypothetical protein
MYLTWSFVLLMAGTLTGEQPLRNRLQGKHLTVLMGNVSDLMSLLRKSLNFILIRFRHRAISSVIQPATSSPMREIFTKFLTGWLNVYISGISLVINFIWIFHFK